jgi:predicted kinase
MKAIIIGPSLSGKTTVVRYLRENYDFSVSEIDEELSEINGGNFPKDTKKKHNVLAPKVIKQILTLPNILFFTNTDYFSDQQLTDAKKLGFTIVQLDLNLADLKKRNKYRMENEGYDDMNQWLKGMVEYQNQIFNKGIVDQRIDATQPTGKIVKDLLDYLTK